MLFYLDLISDSPPNLFIMRFQLYSQLLRLDLSNDHLLQMYYALYYDIPEGEREMAENVDRIITLREKIKLELRGHLFNIKYAIRESKIASTVIEYLPTFLKLEYLARNTFTNTNWKDCYEKERQNIKMYYETLYNQNISSSVVDILLEQKSKLESLPK